MKKLPLCTIVPVLLLVAAGIGRGAHPQSPLQSPLSTEFIKARDQVLPCASEQTYRKIEWRSSVLHGLLDAQKKDRPVMIVLMNGHPLGCT